MIRSHKDGFLFFRLGGGRVRYMLAGWAVWLASSLLPAQQVFVVDRFNRPGTDFTDLPQAVAAANSGDILRLRSTSALLTDAYTAPVIHGKALTIVGETQPVRPKWLGPIIMDGVPANAAMTLSRIDVCSSSQMPSAVQYVQIASCAGSVVFDDVRVAGELSHQVLGGITDCGMIVLRGCSLESDASWTVTRTTMMIENSTLKITVPWWFMTTNGPALWLVDSKLTMTNSTLVGSSAHQFSPLNESPAILTCRSAITIGGGCRLEAGTDLTGGRLNSVVEANCGAYVHVPASTMAVDPATTRAIGGYASDNHLVYSVGPQTGLNCTQTATQLDVDQYTHVGALTALAVGRLTTQPWTHLVGPVFVDPVGFTEYFDFGVATMILRRTLAIPPGLPVGTTVALQAFELLPDGTFLTSNASVVGIW